MDKERKIRDLSKNTVIFALSRLSSKAITVLLVPLYTYVLSTSEYGSIDLVTTTVSLLVPLLTLNVQDAVLRFSLDSAYDPDDVIRVAFRTIVYSLVLLGGALTLAAVCDLWEFSASYAFFCFFSYLGSALNNNLSSYLKAVGKTKVIAVCSILNAAVTCVLNLLFLLVFHWGVEGYMVANVAGALFADIGMLFSGKIRFSSTHCIPKGLLSSMLMYGAPLAIGAIGWWVNSTSDRYILSFFCGTAVNGVYAVAYKIPAILSTMQGVFYSSWSVSAVTEFDKNDTDGFLGDTYTAYSTLSVLLCSFIMLINIFLARILYAKNFFGAWVYVPILLTGTVFSGLSSFLGCLFTAVKKTKSVAATTVLSALINIALNFILIPSMGAMGAALATMISYIALGCIRLCRIRDFISIRVDWRREWFGYAVLLLQSLVASSYKNIVFQIPFFACIILLYFHPFKKSVSIFCRLLWSRSGSHRN